MANRFVILLSFLAVVAGCVNPINQVTEERYTARCIDAEGAGDLPAAEVSCSRALANVAWGNLSKTDQSQDLYNLARIKRKLSKFGEAEDLLRKSIAVEVTLSGENSLPLGRRYVELATNLAAQKKWDEGLVALTKSQPMSSQFSVDERAFAGHVHEYYADHYRDAGDLQQADSLYVFGKSLKP